MQQQHNNNNNRPLLNNGPVIGGANPAKPPKTNVPYSFKKDQVTYFESQYKFGKEGLQAIRGHLSHLLTEKDGGSGPCFKLFASENHCHPVGATKRALFNAQLTHGILKGQKILDVGTSPARLAGQNDFDGKPLSARVWSCNPVLDARDHIRQTIHSKSVELLRASGHYCQHALAPDTRWQDHGCNVCGGHYDAYMLIDSGYYKDGLEGAFRLGAEDATPIYWVINDYDACLRAGNKRGHTVDKESTFEVKQVHGSLQVTSTVKGNIMPYKHGVRGTADYVWQYVYNDYDGLDLVVINEVINRFTDGDVPYIMVRSVAIKAPELVKSGENFGVADVPIRPLFVTDFPQAVLDEEDSLEMYLAHVEDAVQMPAVQQAPATDKKLWPKWGSHKNPAEQQPGSSELEDDDDTTEMVVTSLDERDRLIEQVGDYPTNFESDLSIPEFYHKRIPQAGDKMIDFEKRKETFISNSKLWAAVMRNWHSEVENLTLDVKGGRTWVTLTAAHKTCGFLHFKTLWGESNTYKAPLDWVIEAYKKLGCKKAVQSIQFTLAECQKSDDFTSVAKICRTEITGLQEAFIIALTIKAQEAGRLEQACKVVPSLTRYQASKK